MPSLHFSHAGAANSRVNKRLHFKFQRWSRCGMAEYFLVFIVLHFAVLCEAHEVATMLLSLVIEDGMY